MRRLWIIGMMFCLTLVASAARVKTHRMSDGTVLHFTRSASLTRSSDPITKWDAGKVYKVPVILVSFADRDFSTLELQGEEPQTFYDRLFNQPGFNKRHGAGCVADYFRDQSGGLCNFQFDVVGPVKVEKGCKKYGSYGTSAFEAAVKATDLNYADYDWDGDGSVEAVIFLYAGYGGNETADKADGCIIPSSYNFGVTVGKMRLSQYSASAELWSNDASCGIGTICHEFSHVLGLPDMYPYPTGYDDTLSMLDEWDLMDGGNFADDGWCPPNYSIHEREYVGWQSPIDLTKTTTVTGMKALGEGGEGYRILNDGCPTEYYLLENRQHVGWDYMLPGHGLLITHVDFVRREWKDNTVNTLYSDTDHRHLSYFYADGNDFVEYEKLLEDVGQYNSDGRSNYLQHTAYPYKDGKGIVYDALTDETSPKATLFNANTDGSYLMHKPIKDICEENGLISFRFYESVEAGVTAPETTEQPVAYYDLQGRKVTQPERGIYVVRYSNGTTKKMMR